MLIFLCICAGLATVSLIVATVYLILTLTQLRRTSRTLESLASNANEKVDTFNGMFDTIRSASNGMRSGWFKSIQFALGLVSAYRAQRRQSDQKEKGGTRNSGAAEQSHVKSGGAAEQSHMKSSGAAEQARDQSAGQRQHAWHDSAEGTPPKEQAARQHAARNNTSNEGQGGK